MDIKNNELIITPDNEGKELAFRRQLADLTQKIILLSNGQVVAMIFFGSRLNPAKKPGQAPI